MKYSIYMYIITLLRLSDIYENLLIIDVYQIITTYVDPLPSFNSSVSGIEKCILH